MRVKNHTNIPLDTVRDVARFVCPPGVSRYRIIIHNTARKTLSGNARCSDGRVMVKIPTADRLPAREPFGAYLGYPPHTRIESLVIVLAHELRHLWHHRVPRGRRVWGARGQYSERDADAYALRMLRAWRRRPAA